MALRNFKRLSTVTNVQAAPANGAARLWAVVINKATATAVVNVYNGTTTSDPQVASIDAGTAGPRTVEYGGLLCQKGIFVDQITAAADVTIIYE